MVETTRERAMFAHLRTYRGALAQFLAQQSNRGPLHLYY
jgi:hypothetical protein